MSTKRKFVALTPASMTTSIYTSDSPIETLRPRGAGELTLEDHCRSFVDYFVLADVTVDRKPLSSLKQHLGSRECVVCTFRAASGDSVTLHFDLSVHSVGIETRWSLRVRDQEKRVDMHRCHGPDMDLVSKVLSEPICTGRSRSFPLIRRLFVDRVSWLAHKLDTEEIERCTDSGWVEEGKKTLCDEIERIATSSFRRMMELALINEDNKLPESVK